MDRFENTSFLYREVPVDYDGVARINSIKGNTVKFNQLIQNGNFADGTNNWTAQYGGTISVANNICTLTSTQKDSLMWQTYINLKANHKYLVKGDIKLNSPTTNVSLDFRSSASVNSIYPIATTEWQTLSNIFNNLTDYNAGYVRVIDNRTSGWGNIQIRNIMLIDLTQMFGAGNEPTTPEAFETWLSNNIGLLPYYAYTPGTLIPFKGIGLKTTGKNLLKTDISGTQLGITFTKENGILSARGTTTGSGRIALTNTPFYLPSDCIFSSNVSAGAFEFQFRRDNQNVVTLPTGRTVIVPKGWYDTFALYVAVNNTFNYDFEFQLEIGSTPTSFEPYKESTLSLEALNTLFPTGMKSAGSVYDEATSNRADTRIGAVDLGTLDWNYDSTSYAYAFFTSTTLPTRKVGSLTNAICSKYIVNTGGRYSLGNETGQIASFNETNANSVCVRDDSYTDVESFKQAMSGVMLYYELATPTSQDISLDLTYPVYNNGTEQLLPVNGSTPTTVPILADIDYATGFVNVFTHPNPLLGGETSGDGRYMVGEQATINAVPNEHYIFQNWMLDDEIVSTEEEYTFEVSDE